MQSIRTNKINLLMVFGLLALLAVPACSAANKQKPVSEVYVGGGRACAGKLIIKAKTISWMTPFSQCSSQAYKLVSLPGTNQQNRVFQLSKPTDKCLYHFIYVQTHAETGQLEISGFKTIKDYENKNVEEALICPVIAE